MSNNVTGSGTPTFSAIGPSDTAAEDGGIIVKGTTDKTFLWRGTDGGVSYNYWNSSEHINTNGRNYYVNGIMFASDASKVIGPTNGGGQGQTSSPYTLGSAVTQSSLTTLGTLTGLTCTGDINLQNDGSIFGNSGATGVLTLRSASGNSNHSKIEIGVNEASDNGGVHIYTAGSTVATRAITIKGTSQNVGIGTTSPSQPMTIKRSSSGQAAFGYRLEFEDTDGPTQTSSALLVGSSGLIFKNYNSARTFVFETGHVEPAADNTQNLGASNKRWANVYSGDVHLNNTGMGGNEVDGTEGNWTMQEGADDLFLINRITGKKYKFNLTEV